MTGSSASLKQIFAAARPLVEAWLDAAEQIAALRDTATAAGLDWSQVKALVKAQVQDEREGSGDGKRVRRLVERAEFAAAYADMLGLGGEMNENIFSAAPHDPATGEIIDGTGEDEGASLPAAGDMPDIPAFLRRTVAA